MNLKICLTLLGFLNINLIFAQNISDTLSSNNDNQNSEEQVQNDVITNSTDQQYNQSTLKENNVGFGLDIPVFITRCYIHVPESLQEEIIDHHGGVGYDIGVGLKIDFSEALNMKFGFHNWNKIFNADYKALATDPSGDQVEIVIKENGSFNYLGLYLQMQFNVKYFFIGGGFDISLSKKYKCDYKLYDQSSQLIYEWIEQSNSPLIDDYNGQFDIAIITGLRFKVNEKLIIKPAVEFTIPMQPIINTGVYYTSPIDGETNEVNISAFALKFGTIIEFNF